MYTTESCSDPLLRHPCLDSHTPGAGAANGVSGGGIYLDQGPMVWGPMVGSLKPPPRLRCARWRSCWRTPPARGPRARRRPRGARRMGRGRSIRGWRPSSAAGRCSGPSSPRRAASSPVRAPTRNDPKNK
eukprot:1187050-Prorocentrum_minimum.AAC.3